APEFVDRLVDAYSKGGAGAARTLLNSVAPSVRGSVPKAYQTRVDAIVGALEDFGGEASQITMPDYKFAEAAMRVARRQSATTFGGAAAQKTSQFLRNFNNVTLLGFTTLTSLTDLILPVVRSGSLSSSMKAISRFAVDPEYRRMLSDVGVAMESIVHDRMVHMYGSSDGKYTNAFFNATMLTPWTDMNRKIAGATGFEAFKTMQRKLMKYQDQVPMAQQSRDVKIAHRFMSYYGLQDFLPGGENFRVNIGQPGLADENDALRRAIIKFADDTVFSPNPNDVPIWAQTPFGAIAFQLKSFPLMMSRLAGNVIGRAAKGEVAPLLYLTTLGPGMGMAALGAKDIVQMRGGEDERSAELRTRTLKSVPFSGYDEKIHGKQDSFLGWYVEGMMAMGGLGLFADLLHTAAAQADNGAYGQMRMMSALLGPSAGLV
ncbi:MAG: hypothetical protein EBT12_15880, partial [Marivivens sp.]|nr:hypothetical protein [Marivivens sp.]